MVSNSNPHHPGNPSLKFNKGKDGTMRIPPKDLNIVWGNDTRYWNISDLEAELYQVSWLEVTGFVDETKAIRDYEVGFRLSLKADAFGWGNYPVYIMIKRGKEGTSSWTKVSINPNQKSPFEINWKLMRSNTVEDDQMNRVSNDTKLYFGLYEVWSGKWKGGLKIHSAYVKEF